MRIVQLTSARLGQLRQPQQRIIARNRLKGDVRVPQALLALVFAIIEEPVGENLLGQAGRDHTDLIVLLLLITAGVVHWVDVKFGTRRLARKLS